MTTKASVFDFKVLIDSISDNIDHFDKNISLVLALKQLKNTVECCSSAVTEVQTFVSDYDFDDENEANGYRSFIDVYSSAVERTSNICARLIKVRGSFLFRANNYTHQINEWQQIFYGLSQIFDSLILLHREKTNKTLFTYCNSLDTLLTSTGKGMNQKCFYGDNLGFQFCQSMQLIAKLLVVAMASYSNFFFHKNSMAVKIFNFQVSFTKYFYNSEDRATKFLKTCKKSTAEFCRSYWFLTERRLIHTMPNIIAYSIEVNKLFKIPSEPMELYSGKFKTMIDVPLPRSHSAIGSISCRLMSARKRKGMQLDGTTNANSNEASKYLIFHVHGGGFVSQTSKSHEIYLREWAVKLDAPILSIDYSLAPEAPFPRAIEEVFYAYCWALKNPELCGSTGENIVFVGDSAGGNINTACVLKCIDLGIKKPKGIVSIYTPFILDFSISPSRFISLIDPIIPYEFSTTLHKSYCEELLAKPENQIETSDKFSSALKEIHLLSPFLAPNDFIKEFPPTRLVSATFDPFVDDCVEFGKRLRSLEVDVQIDVVKGLPHGFLYFTQISKDCHSASMVCVNRIKSLLEL